MAMVDAQATSVEAPLRLTGFGQAGVARVHRNTSLLKLVSLEQLQEHGKFSDEDIADYKRFLAIRAAISEAVNPEAMLLSPTDDMDAVWHAHILDTRSYKTTCELLLGKNGFIHHDPYPVKDLAVRSARRALLMAIWKAAFPDVAKPKNGWGADPNATQHYIERLTGRKRRRPTDADFQIFVRTMTAGRTITVDVSEDTEVEDLKLLLHDRKEAPLELMRILKGGTQLEDGRTMRFYGIKKETTLTLVIRAVGC